MSTAIDPSGAFAESHGGSFVSKDEKAEVFRDQDAMYVVHAEAASEGVYGVQTVFHVKAKKWGKDETRLLAFAHNEQRQRLAENLLQLINANPGSPVGPVYLHKFVSKSGNEGWELKPTPYQGNMTPPVPKAEVAPAVVASAGSVTDDSLPF